MFKNCHKGFTLLELLVVVLIIGILAGIALPNYRVSVLRSEYTVMKNIANSIKESQDIYYLMHNKYTTNISDLDISFSSFRQEDSTIYFKNGDCTMFENGGQIRYIDCNLYHGNSENVLFQYSLGLPSANNVKKGVCSVFSVDTSDTLNKVCQLETSKEEPYKCYKTFCQYEYD